MTASLNSNAPYHLPAFIHGGFAEIVDGSPSAPGKQALPPEELTRDSVDEEIMRLKHAKATF